MEAAGDPARPVGVQEEENVAAVRPPRLLRAGGAPHVPGVQILLQDPGECHVTSGPSSEGGGPLFTSHATETPVAVAKRSRV